MNICTTMGIVHKIRKFVANLFFVSLDDYNYFYKFHISENINLFKKLPIAKVFFLNVVVDL